MSGNTDYGLDFELGEEIDALFAVLPDYLEEVKKEKEEQAATGNALSGFVTRVVEAILSKGKVKA